MSACSIDPDLVREEISHATKDFQYTLRVDENAKNALDEGTFCDTFYDYEIMLGHFNEIMFSPKPTTDILVSEKEQLMVTEWGEKMLKTSAASRDKRKRKSLQRKERDQRMQLKRLDKLRKKAELLEQSLQKGPQKQPRGPKPEQSKSPRKPKSKSKRRQVAYPVVQSNLSPIFEALESRDERDDSPKSVKLPIEDLDDHELSLTASIERRVSANMLALQEIDEIQPVNFAISTTNEKRPIKVALEGMDADEPIILFEDIMEERPLKICEREGFNAENPIQLDPIMEPIQPVSKPSKPVIVCYLEDLDDDDNAVRIRPLLSKHGYFASLQQVRIQE